MSKTSYIDYILSIVPSNIFEPFINHQVIGVLLVSGVLTFAIKSMSNTSQKQILVDLLGGMHAIFLKITTWVVKTIPLAIYGFVTLTTIEFSKNMQFEEISKYLLVVVLANIIQGFIILPLWLHRNNLAPMSLLQGSFAALSMAFFSKSSSGTLPVTMNCAENNLNIDPKLSRSILPLCTTINMNGCAAFIFATVIFVSQSNGIIFTPFTMLPWIFIATIAAIGNAGVPMGCFFLSASLLSSMDVPIALMGIILPFYSIIDMIETSLNVWSDISVTSVINKNFLSYKNIPTD